MSDHKFNPTQSQAISYFDSQVCNGGIQQWIDNRYAQPKTITLVQAWLYSMGQDGLVEVMNEVLEFTSNGEWNESEAYDEEDFVPALYGAMEHFDSNYYAFRDANLAQIEAHY